MSREIKFLIGSLSDLQGLPKEVKQEIGFALKGAQLGEEPINMVCLAGYGSSKVREIVTNCCGDT
jgi:phage-related protein